MLNIDTHILVHALEGNLTAAEKSVIAGEQLGVSAIVLWEIEMLFQRKRINFGLDDPRVAMAFNALQVWPVTPEICLNLRRIDFRSDRADELIWSTSFTHRVPLVTRDQRIRESRLIDFAG